MEGLVQLIIDFAMHYPAVASVLFVIGGFRIFMKPLFSVLHAYVDFTPSQADNELLDKVEQNPFMKAFMYALDYIFSLKLQKP